MATTAWSGAELIATRRREAGKSGRKAALDAGISPTYWFAVERGESRPSDDVLARMAAVLWITSAELARVGREAAGAELDRQLEVAPSEKLAKAARSLVEEAATVRDLTEGQKREMFAEVMRAITGGGE